MRSLQNQLQLCTRAQWTLAGVLFGGLLLFYLIGYLPAAKRLEALTLQINGKKRELEQSQDKAKNLPILAMEVQQLESKVQLYDRQFPRQPQLGPFIRDLTQISQQLALREWKYQPGAPRRTEAFQEMPILMQFEGDFRNAASFLQQVESMQRLTRVKRLHLKGKNSAAGNVEVEAALSIYFSEG